MPTTSYKKQCSELTEFCQKNNITQIGNEFFFEFEGVQYKITRYVVRFRNEGKDFLLQKPKSSRNQIILPTEIYGKKGDVIRIYNDLIDGIPLDFSTGQRIVPDGDAGAATVSEKLSKAETKPAVQPVVKRPAIRRPASSKQDVLDQLLKRR